MAAHFWLTFIATMWPWGFPNKFKCLGVCLHYVSVALWGVKSCRPLSFPLWYWQMSMEGMKPLIPGSSPLASVISCIWFSSSSCFCFFTFLASFSKSPLCFDQFFLSSSGLLVRIIQAVIPESSGLPSSLF